MDDSDRTVLASDEAEWDGQRRLGAAFARIDEIAARLDGGVGVEPGSQMESDDAATEYDRMSHLVNRLLLSAVDHLWTLGHLLQVGGGVPPFSCYTLIRAGLEGAALAIWIIHHGKRQRRILRSLQFAHRSFKDVAPLGTVLGAVQMDLEKTRIRLDGLRAAAGVASDSDVTNFPRISEVVLIAQGKVAPALARRTLSGIDVWRMCSGMAHHNPVVAFSVMERRHVARASDGKSGSYEMTTSIAVLADCTGVAVNFLTHALSAYERACKRQPGAREQGFRT